MAGSMSNYARRMARLSARIFGEVARPTNAQSMKVARMFEAKPLEARKDIGENYYPRHVELNSLLKQLRFLGLYRDEHQDFVDEMRRLRALRGKSKPKKGEGKRAMRKK